MSGEEAIPLPPTGSELNCKGWHQEAALRCLLNNLHPEVAEDRDNLIVYGGNGQAARNHKALMDIIEALKSLENDETLLIQSGKPVGILPTHPHGPRVLIANSNLVPQWASWDHFNRLKAEGLTMYGQMTAGSWIYIGSQGILQGTYETFMAAAQKHYGPNSSLKGRLVLSAGLGGMGGAQPLAVKMAEGVFIGCDCDRDRIQKRLDSGYLDHLCDNFDQALEVALKAQKDKQMLSVAVVGNAADFYSYLLERGVVPDLVTDQTSAHDPLNGYFPQGMSLSEAVLLRESKPEEYVDQSHQTMAKHVWAMLEFQKKGSHVFDYGNNLRAGAVTGGEAKAFDFPGFVPAYIRPLFCRGSGPFRWIALSGEAADIHTTDRALKELFPHNKKLINWLEKAHEMVSFQGLPSRICWLEYGERAQAGLLFNRLVREGRVAAPHCDRTGPFGLWFCSLSLPRDGGDVGRFRCGQRLAPAQLDGKYHEWRFVDEFSPWRRCGNGLLPALGHGHCL